LLARSPDRLKWIENLPVRVVYGDVGRPETLPALVEGQDVVIHSAALTKATGLEGFARVNVGGTENLLRAVTAANPGLRRFIFLSSQEAMGPCPDCLPIREEAEQAPISMYGKSKAMAERALLAFRESVPTTTIRPPVVYGPRERDIYAYFKLAERGMAPIAGSGITLNTVYVKNLVLGIALAAEKADGGFTSYFFTDGPALSWDEFSDLLAQALDRRITKIHVPLFVVGAIARVSGIYTALTRRPVLLSPDKIEAMRHEFWTVSDQRARSELGYRPAYTTLEGLRETARWYRTKGWL
jgi:dihydroflavonol-4-reductase